MIIVLSPKATEADKNHIIETVRQKGLDVNVSTGTERTVIGVIGDETVVGSIPLEIFNGVEKVMPVTKPYKRVSRDFHPEATVVLLGKGRADATPVAIGGGAFALIAGPCSVENEAQIIETAHAVKAAGAQALRGGAYKPRTSPYSFQGHGPEGLRMLAAARAATGLPIVTEVMDARDVALVAEEADCLQIGARNMQNFTLLREVGQARKPVLLKRGLAATVEDLLLSAEYVLAGGNTEVILCEGVPQHRGHLGHPRLPGTLAPPDRLRSLSRPRQADAHHRPLRRRGRRRMRRPDDRMSSRSRARDVRRPPVPHRAGRSRRLHRPAPPLRRSRRQAPPLAP